MPVEMKELMIPERSRTYHYPCGGKLTVANVTHVGVSQSGNHRLRTADGTLWCVIASFMGIEIDADAWSI